VSCNRTREVLDAKKATIKEERLAKKAPLTDADVKTLLASVNEVIVAKGKASRTIPAPDVVRADLLGPTGNFRAPMIRKGKTLLVGFHPDTLGKLLR
jgi:arsenate reductase-like glutaredoxin family protein